MNKRHTSLDGLRGFAALSVFFAHAGFSIATLTTIPLVIIAYSTLAVGTNAVQILFVLSGFLMAYLYSEEIHAWRFIRKRYTRIFPVFIVIITYLWLINLQKELEWYFQLVLLFIVAITFHFVWKAIRKVDINGIIRTAIFWGFIIFQLLLVIFLSITDAHFKMIPYPPIFIELANITLTSDFSSSLMRLLNQAWSLVPEVLFYLSFPFLAIPLINLAKKRGIVVGIALVLGMTKIFFDLDTALYSYANLQSINIARACGFIAGIVIGIAYKSQGEIWNILEKIFRYSLSGILIFLLFLFLQWKIGNTIASGTASILELNSYSLLSSWVIALLIVAIILPNTAMNKFFGHKSIAFFGVISYSVYLIHTSMLQIVHTISNYISVSIPFTTYISIFDLLFALTLTIVVSYLLFRYIESLYFLDKKHVNNKALAKPVVIDHHKQKKSVIRILVAGAIFTLILFIVYAGNYSYSLLVARNIIISSSFINNQEISLTSKPFLIPFTAQFKNLSEVVILLRYTNNSGFTMDKIKHHRQLVFRLYTMDRKLLFESKRDAYEVDGMLRFPFGFSPQKNSKGKKYLAEIFLQGRANGENILVNTFPTSFVSIYINTPESRIRLLPSVLQNRFLFAATNPDAQFAFGFLVLILLLELTPEKLKLPRLNSKIFPKPNKLQLVIIKKWLLPSSLKKLRGKSLK